MSSKRGRCEICGGEEGGVRRLSLADRTILLCAAHTVQAEAAGAPSVDVLRASFREAEGRRTLLSRRAPEERRQFPPRPEGRRHDDGRRTGD
jgi:hypothetical protein